MREYLFAFLFNQTSVVLYWTTIMKGMSDQMLKLTIRIWNTPDLKFNILQV